jgi:hypothetical protein
MSDRFELLLAGPLVMAASLHAATEVWRRREDRRRGHDDSTTEPGDQARNHLSDALDVLSDLAFRAAASEVAASNVDPTDGGAYVLHFDGLLRLNRAAGLLEETHRRLLSLYPIASPVLVEKARTLASETRQALEADEPMPHAEIRLFVRDVREALSV